MSSMTGKTVIVTGGSAGVGREAVRQLCAEGARVTTVARTEAGLARLRSEISGELHTVVGDAADPALADRLVRELAPDGLVLCAGVRPTMGPVDQLSWEAFSEPWNVDVKSAFHFGKAALGLPLRSGSAVVIVSSGAAIGGSPLSGGYAGAKRMQWFLAGYLQKLANERKLGIRAVAVLPKQLIEGTDIGATAAAAYGGQKGVSSEQFMKQWDAPLDAGKVAAAIISALRGDLDAGVTAIGVTGKGFEPLG